MAKSTTTKKQSTEPSVSTPVPVSEPTSIQKETTPVVKKEKKASAPKKTKSVEASPPVEDATQPVVESSLEPKGQPEVSDSENVVSEYSVDFVSKMQQLVSLVSTLKADFKQLEKKYLKDLKVAQKQSVKKKRKSGNRAPSGFVKPTEISPELADFLSKPHGTEMARTTVTREINEYIRTHSLQDKTNGRKILPDKKLATLLKLTKDDELTYFNLQKYMSRHFSKNGKTFETTPATAVVA